MEENNVIELDAGPKMIAVYGTLRMGQGANYLMDNCEHIGQDHVYGQLYDQGGYPGIILTQHWYGDDVNAIPFPFLSTSPTTVVDVLRLPKNSEEAKEVLELLDMYEGTNREDPLNHRNSLFTRHVTRTQEFGWPVWIYQYAGYSEEGVDETFMGEKIASGDYLEHRGLVSYA